MSPLEILLRVMRRKWEEEDVDGAVSSDISNWSPDDTRI
jgi:hypothetical protein